MAYALYLSLLSGDCTPLSRKGVMGAIGAGEIAGMTFCMKRKRLDAGALRALEKTFGIKRDL